MGNLARPLLQPLTQPLVQRLDAALSTGGGGPFRVTDSILGAGGLDYALYDSSALDRVWQEVTGQTPANANSPVGLIVGREKQKAKTFAQVMAAQPELLTNGSFDNGFASWTTPNGESALIDGRARVTSNSTSASGRIAQSVQLVVGKTYVASVDGYVGNDKARIVVGTSTAPAGQIASQEISANGRINLVFTATATSMFILGYATGAVVGRYAEYDNFSLKEIPAHYANQAIGAARPSLQASGVLFDGSDDTLTSDWVANPNSPNCILAQLSVPATLAGNQYVAGAFNSATGRMFMGFNSSSGRLRSGVGGTGPDYGTDYRGTEVICAIVSTGAGEAIAYANNVEVGRNATDGLMPTSPFNLGSIRNGSSNTNFWPGTIKRAAFGLANLDLDQFQKISAEWRAAA